MIKILMIDDNEDDFILVRDVLDDGFPGKFAINWISSYETGVKELRSLAYDICLLDYRLGVNDGLGLIRESGIDVTHFPVILLTGRGDTSIDESAIRLGAADYLVKSEISPEQLERAIRHALERSKILAAITESEAKFRFMAENVADVIWMTGLDKKFSYASPSVEKLLGITPDEILAMPLEEIILPSSYDEISKQLDESPLIDGKRGAVIYNAEMELLRKDGTHVWTEATISEIRNVHGALTGFIGVTRNIARRKLAEMELRKAKEEAEEANRMKDKFISIVAHDLRAPFNAILGLLQLIERDANSSLSEPSREKLGYVIESSNNMLAMIDKLLNISRLNAGGMKIFPLFMPARVLADKVLSMYQATADAKGISLANDVPEHYRIYADPDLFAEAVKNMVSNSIKFTRKGGRIRVFVPEGESCGIAVQDNGIGIDPKIMDDLFRHEVKTTRPGTAGERGTGLGLPYSHDIIKAHSGRLAVKSATGEGTVFHVSLPNCVPMILVVDDDQLSRVSLAHSLSKLNVNVLEAADGKEALDILSAHKPHLVITDMMMPVMDGLSVIREIRKNPVTKNMPLIALTGDNDVQASVRALEAGANDFIRKPVTTEDIMTRIKRFIS